MLKLSLGLGLSRRGGAAAATPAYQQILNLASADGWTAVYDPTNPNTRTTRESGGSTFISAIADGLGNLGDATRGIEAQQPVYVDPWQDHDGADDKLVFSWPVGQRASDMRLYYVLRTTDTKYMVLGPSGGADSEFLGAVESGGASSPHSLAGSPTYRVDGAALSSPTRNDLFNAISDGAPHILEARGVDFTSSGWGSAQWSGRRADSGETAWLMDGEIGAILLAETANISSSTHDEIMSILADTYGVTLA